MNLNEAQQLFKKGMLKHKPDSEALKNLRACGSMSLEDAFHLYQKAYRSRFHLSLGKTFETVKQILGAERFNDLVNSYIDSKDSVKFDLSQYGEEFPAHMKRVCDNAHPFLYDLACFEWHLKRLIDAPQSLSLPMKMAKEQLNGPNCKVHFILAMDLFESAFAIYELWRNRKDSNFDLKSIDWKKAEAILIYKKQSKAHVQKISFKDAEILRALKGGSSLHKALAQTSLLSAEEISNFFNLMLKTEIIEDILVLEESVS